MKIKLGQKKTKKPISVKGIGTDKGRDELEGMRKTLKYNEDEMKDTEKKARKIYIRGIGEIEAQKWKDKKKKGSIKLRLKK